MNKNTKIYVAGHQGLVGSALVRELANQGYLNIITKTFQELDLRNQQQTLDFFAKEKPDYVFLAAAKVGGIHANNTYKAEFIYDNLMIASNVIHAAYKYNVKKLLNLGSSCIYPKHASQPLKEEYLLTGPLEPTNESYAIAKIAAIKLCRYYNEQYGTNFISVMPTNLYGPNDNFNLETSHVLPALLRKFHDAKVKNEDSVTLWGTGKPYREFMYVEDMAQACIFLMQKYNAKEVGEFVNIGTGQDVTIKELAKLIKNIIGFTGKIIFDNSKSDGTPRKLLDVSSIHQLGWKHTVNLVEGLQKTYSWYHKTRENQLIDISPKNENAINA